MSQSDESGLRFYEVIAEFYDELFPLAPKKASFCRNNLKSGHHELLDIGCATGELCFELEKDGHRIIGLDADARMVEIARRKMGDSGLIDFITGDMRQLHRHFSPNSLDAAFCFGNTMAHLEGTDEIARFLEQIYNVLNPGGVFLGQLVNYEKILEQNIEELPLIERGDVLFKRSYNYDRSDNSIIFAGELRLKKSGRTLHSRVRLHPLTMVELREVLTDVSFKNIEFYGNFNRNPYSSEAGALVFAAKK